MIRIIEKIRAFGIFADFKWHSGIPPFKQRNLIYGWNYSGKTTLSRVFRCFEQCQLHSDFPSADVQIKGEDGNVHNLSFATTAPTFRVFNTDFVRDNLSFDSGTASPILVLGAEDIAKQETLKAKKAERDALVTSKDAHEKKKIEIIAAIEASLTHYARDIKNQLNEVNYDKRRFDPKVKACKNEFEKRILDENALTNYLAIYRSTDKKPELSAKTVNMTSVAELREKAEALLARVVAASNPITRLKENPEIEAWVNEG